MQSQAAENMLLRTYHTDDVGTWGYLHDLVAPNRDTTMRRHTERNIQIAMVSEFQRLGNRPSSEVALWLSVR